MNGKKTSLVKARLPKGMRDVEAQELRALKAMLDTVADVYERYGFEPLDTPAFEYTDALGKFLPDTDRPNEGVFSFQDEDEQWVSLRYDLTAPLARYVAANFDALPKPFRRYQTGYVYRNEKPGPGRFRQFMQFDADTVGTANPAADAEMCMLAADTLEALGLNGNYVIKVSNRKILDGVMEAAEIPVHKRPTAFRAIDKLDKIGLSGVIALLGKERRDESGDVTKGADLDEDQIGYITSFIGSTANVNLADRQVTYIQASVGTRFHESRQDLQSAGVSSPIPDLHGERVYPSTDMTLGFLRQKVGSSSVGLAGVGELEAIFDLCLAVGYDVNRIMIDASVVRGLEYYTGPVFEAELTIPATNETGQVVRFGSVGGGGRYDGLVSRFRAQPVPATGFSIGVSRLYSALTHLGKLQANGAERGPVVVLVMDKSRIGDYQRMVQDLRFPKDGGKPVRAEMYVGDAGMKAQMKYADRRGSPCVIIQGEDERARGEVTIKDLVEGTRLSGEIAGREEWREARPAQFSVPASDMVKEVRLLLERQPRG
jgi:histidyl-tRNA synthetase